jgi:ribonuclease E
MLINYVPGEECRVAVAEDGKLEELHQESTSNLSRVGNVYVGVVANVEPAIQAAFIDFGVEDHGFLHITDLHPQYFPGEDDDTTERIGKKTSRRDRPPIQQCLKRGQEVAVQVLKEGIGTKGPTLTSYLSIPGRFLVMMPQMDRVGVSRKVEDEEVRRQMREILDQLELPEGFGFIVRTAGLDRNKTELKRDLAYLQRLWKDMEKRWNTGKGPRLLYTESDLLLRALRDLVGPETSEVIVDNEQALNRAARFLKIVSPRSQTRLVHYTGRTPLFHATGIEDQILNIHAREVPLPSGGRLVIDETEALVAIDVNSGKSRSARDAETNAYKTNLEAIDEISRQLRLRDLGGVVVNDLIDMRDLKHRREIEARFKERLKRDRARSTTAPISEFGILEMTRQRMRGSHESVHFIGCPTCRGRGLVQRPDSVAADALRSLAALLEHDKIARVEMVVSPRVAGELLSSKRKSLGRLERNSGRHVDVRVSETHAVDRVSFYAYDAQGADVDLEQLPRGRTPAASDLVVWQPTGDETWAVEPEGAAPEPADEPEAVELAAHPIEMDLPEGEEASQPGDPSALGGKKKRRRRGGRGRGRGGAGGEPQAAGAPGAPQASQPSDADAGDGGSQSGSQSGHPQGHDQSHDHAHDQGHGPETPGEPGRRKRRRRRGRGRGRDSAPGPDGPHDAGARPGAHTSQHDGQGSAPPSRPAPRPENRQPARSGWGGEGDHGGPDAAAPLVDDLAELPQTEGGIADGPDQEFDAAQEPGGVQGPEQQGDQPGGQGRRRRRRRRRRGGGGGMNADPHAAGQVPQDGPAQGLSQGQQPPDQLADQDQDSGRIDDAEASPDEAAQDGAPASADSGAPQEGQDGQGGGRRRRRRRRGGRGRGDGPGPAQGGEPRPQGSNQPAPSGSLYQNRLRPDAAPQTPAAPVVVRATPQTTAPTGNSSGQPQPTAPPKRFLYSTRRKLSPGEVARLPKD